MLHFVCVGINDEGLSGYQVVRGALKGFNTGWATYTGDNDGYYKNYPDEIISLARWYYDEGHLYDNVFSWTNDERIASYREGDVWAWWGDGEPSLAEVTEAPKNVKGDVNGDGEFNVADLVLMQRFILGKSTLVKPENGDVCKDGSLDVFDVVEMRKMVLKQTD